MIGKDGALLEASGDSFPLSGNWLSEAGADVARTLDEEHAAIVEVLAAWLRGLGLEVGAEASYSVYGERGRVDLLAFDAATGRLHVVEVKTDAPNVIHRERERRAFT